jgi:serine/threonine protein kinase
MLDYLFKRVQFNHRDMKSNNIMYSVGADKNIKIKLIDFGFCCLTWNGIRVQGTAYFQPTSNCFSLFRDITQLVYELYITYENVFSSKLVAQLKDILTVTVRGRTCRMYRGCPDYGLIKWPDNYDFLARMNVSNPAGEPAEIVRRLKQVFNVGTNYNFSRPVPALVDAIACDPTEILDPVTGDCVPRGSPHGEELVLSVERRSPGPVGPQRPLGPQAPKALGPCKQTNQVRDPVTRRCRKVNAFKTAKAAVKSRKNISVPNPADKENGVLDQVIFII